MASGKDIIEGLTILKKYSLSGDIEVSAIDDGICSGPSLKETERMTKLDAKRLHALGWFKDEMFDYWKVYI